MWCFPPGVCVLCHHFVVLSFSDLLVCCTDVPGGGMGRGSTLRGRFAARRLPGGKRTRTMSSVAAKESTTAGADQLPPTGATVCMQRASGLRGTGRDVEQKVDANRGEVGATTGARSNPSALPSGHSQRALPRGHGQHTGLRAATATVVSVDAEGTAKV